jgi:hypothetical protein
VIAAQSPSATTGRSVRSDPPRRIFPSPASVGPLFPLTAGAKLQRYEYATFQANDDPALRLAIYRRA